jgi:hypothetical protein
MHELPTPFEGFVLLPQGALGESEPPGDAVFVDGVFEEGVFE